MAICDTQGIHLCMLSLDIWFECDDVKMIQIEFNHFYNSGSVYVLICRRSTWWKDFRDNGLVPMDATCWVSWWEGTETPYSTGSSWRPLFTFIHFIFFIHWPLSPAASGVVVLILFCLFRTYIWNRESMCSSYVCILCGLLSCDNIPISKKCCCVYTLATLLMMNRIAQWNMSSLYSLLIILYLNVNESLLTFSMPEQRCKLHIFPRKCGFWKNCSS